MPPRSRFTRLDAFTKTVEDARIRTTSGGVVTIVSLLVILFLIWGEWSDYRRIVVRPELVVDKGRGEKMEIHMNITFPSMPCELLSLDVMDVSGDVQSGVMHGVKKVRLSPASQGSHAIEATDLDLHADEAYHLAPDYCGECYGAEAPSNAKKPGCCNTCTEVRDAYAAKSWSFGLGDNVEQCQREHYAEHVIEQRKEGCRIEGGIRVNKVIGNFHFAPGKSFSHENVHLHDLAVFRDSPEHHSFSHSIHHMRFGPELPEGLAKRYGGKAALAWTNHHASPLDGTEQLVNEKTWSFMYFIKVVPTAYLPLGWETQGYHPFKGLEDNHHEDTALGKYGMSELGSVETHQYSVTSHKRSLFGGDEEKEGHKERIHSSGGIPGIFFSYDISPMKVINRESRSKSFSSFLVGVCAVIGGTLTVAAAIDRGWYEGRRRMAGEKQHER